MRTHAGVSIATVLSAFVSGFAVSCSDRSATEACYFVDDADDYADIGHNEFCEYELNEFSPLRDEYGPEAVDYFITCDEVPVDHLCQTCTSDSDELDEKVHGALDAEYEARCPDGPRDLIDFERGCMFESSPHPPDNTTKSCCYTAIVVGECSLKT